MIRRKIRLKKSSRKEKKKGKDECHCSNEIGPDDIESSIDMETANSQYSMARRFAQSLLKWECPIARKNYCDIADVILDRLSEQLGYKLTGNEDRKSQQMRILTDVFACWISGILVEVSEKHRTELEEERMTKLREDELMAEREEFQIEEEENEQDDFDRKNKDDDEDDDDDGDDDDDDDDGDGDESLPKVSESDVAEAENAGVVKKEPSDDEGESDEEQKNIWKIKPEKEFKETARGVESFDARAVEEFEKEIEEPENEGMVEVAEIGVAEIEEVEEAVYEDDSSFIDDSEDMEQLTEIEEKKNVSTEDEIESKEQNIMIEKIASRISQVFKIDSPFVTFVRILDTICSIIELEGENFLDDPIDNRIHRAIYNKFKWLISYEDPVLFNEHTKDVVNVISGKIAKWLRQALNEQQIKLLLENSTIVESSKMRDWFKWIINMTDMALNWSSWIKMMTGESNKFKVAEKIKRDQWQDWTNKFESDALLWRGKYVEAVHQQHHNTMMMSDRKIVETGDKQNPHLSDKTLQYQF